MTPTRPSALRAEFATFFALFSRGLRSNFAYRPALLLAMLSAALSYAVPMLVWRHIYASGGGSKAVPAQALFPYLLLAGCLNFGFAMNVESRIGQRIRMGLIATDLLRPVDFQMAQLSQALSDGIANLAFVLPVFGVACAFWGKSAFPHDAAAFFAFCASVLLAFVILFAVSFIFVQATFITYSSYGVFVARNALQQTFSGMSAPLALFPAGLRAASEWLPFRHTIHTPVSIYLGWINGSAVWAALGAQLIWALGLLLVGRYMLRVSLLKFEIQGG